MMLPVWEQVRRFNPRLPGGRRPQCSRNCSSARRFQSTPSGGKATRRAGRRGGVEVVSIHAFRGEGDQASGRPGRAGSSFNPRLPGGRRPQPTSKTSSSRGFQSTPSGGKATRRREYPTRRSGVSIHAFRGEGDDRGARRLDVQLGFNPRLPGGRRPDTAALRAVKRRVSIHAFRGEGDAARHQSRHRASVSIHAFRGEGDRNI